MSRSKIPDRWINYTPFNKVIKGTKFLPMKVPLKDEFSKYLDNSSQVFSPRSFSELCKNKNLNVGIIIDLTFTRKYYNPHEMESYGIQYKKIFTEGHEVPKMSVLKEFRQVVNDFIEHSSSDSIIAVHCTHGVNRTGYVLCHYMINELGISPQEAIDAFGDGRGYPIERPNYLASLYGQRKTLHHRSTVSFPSSNYSGMASKHNLIDGSSRNQSNIMSRLESTRWHPTDYSNPFSLNPPKRDGIYRNSNNEQARLTEPTEVYDKGIQYYGASQSRNHVPRNFALPERSNGNRNFYERGPPWRGRCDRSYVYPRNKKYRKERYDGKESYNPY